jgi:hypothetical protein
MSRRTIAGILAVLAVVCVIGGFYEYNQKVTCGPNAAASCKAGKHRHPHRAYAGWVLGAIFAVSAVTVYITDPERR